MMRPNVYIRRDSEESLPIRRDSREDELQTAGLRSTPLCLLIVGLIVLAVLAVTLLVLNIMLIHTLDMSSSGMKLLKFYSVHNQKTGADEKVVHFGGSEMDLGSVVSSSGRVGGGVDSDLNVYGSRVIIEGEPSGARLTLQETGCKFEMVKDFQIVSSRSGRPVFSAQHPLVILDKKIKKISSAKIVTNLVRSSVNEKLRVSVEDISVRGNEAVRLEAKNIHFASGTGITFNTTRDGSLYLRGSVFIGGAHSGVPLSQSPALRASIDAFRVCVCSSPTHRLFVVPGNRGCLAPEDICA